MSQTSEQLMNKFVDEITLLKDRIIDMIGKKVDRVNIDDACKRMREIHGKAICENQKQINNVLIKSTNNQTAQDYLKISMNCTCLDIIHKHICRCEKRMVISDDHQEQPSNMTNYPVDNNNINMIIRKKDGFDEISIKNEEIESDFDPQTTIDRTKHNNNDDLRYTDMNNVTEYINNVSNSELNKLEKQYKMEKNINQQNGGELNEYNKMMQQKNLDINKPTLVKYWSDTCPACIKFGPTWEKFEIDSKNKFPELQVLDLVLNTRESSELANKIGINSVPTIALFANGKISKNDKGSRTTVSDIENFVRQNLRQ